MDLVVKFKDETLLQIRNDLLELIPYQSSQQRQLTNVALVDFVKVALVHLWPNRESLSTASCKNRIRRLCYLFDAVDIDLLGVSHKNSPTHFWH